jgi:hypothetical protein
MFLQLLSYYRYPSLSLWCHNKMTVINSIYKYYPIVHNVKTTHALSSYLLSARQSKWFVPLTAIKSELFAAVSPRSPWKRRNKGGYWPNTYPTSQTFLHEDS